MRCISHSENKKLQCLCCACNISTNAHKFCHQCVFANDICNPWANIPNVIFCQLSFQSIVSCPKTISMTPQHLYYFCLRLPLLARLTHDWTIIGSKPYIPAEKRRFSNLKKILWFLRVRNQNAEQAGNALNHFGCHQKAKAIFAFHTFFVCRNLASNFWCLNSILLTFGIFLRISTFISSRPIKYFYPPSSQISSI